MLDFHYLRRLREKHIALRVLNADNTPLILSFFFQVFILPNQRSIKASKLEELLSDTLDKYNTENSEYTFSLSARAYLDSWSDESSPYLRKYYQSGEEEAVYDLHPEIEQVIKWLQSLDDKKPFIGTESRFLTIFRLLNEIVNQTQSDPKQKIIQLEKEKAELERKIAEAEEGILESFDDRQVTERLIQAEETAKQLLSDFRKVEESFRELDRSVREKIAQSDESKGELLDQIFSEHDIIWGSDQGKSFGAFWEFLMSPERQQELQLLVKSASLTAKNAEKEIKFLKGMHRHLVDAGEPVYRSNNQLTEQLRRLLSSQVYFENKRISEIIKSIEKNAVEITNCPPQISEFSNIQSFKSDIKLTIDRPLFSIPADPLQLSEKLFEGEADLDKAVLFNQNYIDIKELSENIRRALQLKTQISLKELIDFYPLKKGAAEIIGYFSLAVKNNAVIDSFTEEIILLQGFEGAYRELKMPRVIFLSEEGVV